VRLVGDSMALDLTPQAAQRGGRDDALGRAADADREMVVRAPDRGADRGDDVAVGDQLDAGAGLADLGDQVVVPGPVEHDRGHVGHLAAERIGDRLQVLAHRAAQVDAALGDRPDGHLAHVHPRHLHQAAGVAGGEDRERAPAPALPDRARRLGRRP